MEKQPKNFLFVHAGPGLNAEPERRILGQYSSQIGGKFYFWDEPSAQRPDGRHYDASEPLQSFRDSLREVVREIKLRENAPLVLVANSWTARLAEDLMVQFPEWIEAAIFVAPTSQLQITFEKMIEQLQIDFTQQGSPFALQLQTYQRTTHEFYDPATQAALALSAQDPVFIEHYWKNKQAFLNWAEALGSHPKFQYDPLAQNRVFQKLQTQALKQFDHSSIPLTLIFGDADPFVDQPKEIENFQKRFLNLSVQNFAESSHFPHLEEPEKFINLIRMI